MKKHIFLLMLLLSGVIYAKTPTGYYNKVEGKTENSILDALNSIISSHTDVGYDGLYDVYKTSDVTSEGYVWDMYSTCSFEHKDTQHCGNYQNVCDCYNREHSVPQSWWSGAHMKSDAFHVYPTDGKVNGQRGNHPYGECANGKVVGSGALGKLGTSTFAGYTNIGTVFEPVDEYKGDFARSYFYMIACYLGNSMTASEGKTIFTYSNSKSNLTAYGVALLMKWHRQDPVSDKELKRNDAVYSKQKNRNPFIDYPELAEYIWGNKKGEKIDLSKLNNAYESVSYNYPIILSPMDNENISVGTTTINEPITQSFYVRGAVLSKNLTLTIGGDNPAFFTVSPSTVTAEQAMTEVGQNVAIIYNPTQTGTHRATLTISSNEIADVVVNLIGIGKLNGSTDPFDVPNGDYVRLESNPEDMEGVYLIVNDSYNKVLDGSKAGDKDFSKSMISVSIVDNVIAATEEIDAASFKIQVSQGGDGYDIISKDGYYIGIAQNKNALDASKENEYVNSINVASGNATIMGTGSYSNRTLRYNDNGGSSMFRFYTSGQDPVQLYKKVSNTTPTDIEQNAVEKPYKIYVANGAIVVETETDINIEVYDYMGRSVGNEGSILPRGLYIVRIGENVEKILVR